MKFLLFFAKMIVMIKPQKSNGKGISHQLLKTATNRAHSKNSKNYCRVVKVSRILLTKIKFPTL